MLLHRLYTIYISRPIRKFKNIIIAKNNQEIVDNCNWVFLSITPTVGQKIIKELKFKKYIGSVVDAQKTLGVNDEKIKILPQQDASRIVQDYNNQDVNGKIKYLNDLEKTYGVLTPSYAMGDNILERLESNAGLSFKKIK